MDARVPASPSTAASAAGASGSASASGGAAGHREELWWRNYTAEELAAIDALDTGVRGGPDPAQLSPETYPKVVDNS